MKTDYPPKIQEDGGACVSPRQLEIHELTEAASVLIGRKTRSRRLCRRGGHRRRVALVPLPGCQGAR